jgi:flagellar motor switch protein FliG
LFSAVSLLFFVFQIGPVTLNGAESMDISIIEKQDSLRKEAETKIKNEILDPIMGPGKSFVFADVELEIIARKAEQNKEGIGVLQKYKEKQGTGSTGSTDFLLPGVPKPKSVLGTENKRPEAAQGQQAEQGKSVQEIRYGIQTEINRFQVTVIYDETVSSATVAVARGRVGEFLLPYKIKGRDEPTVVFKPTKFKSYTMLDDLKRPSVYLSLLYAVLFLLLLLFLFGPLWGFFRKYIGALLAKPGAEVNIDQKMEGGGAGGEGKSEGATEGHQQIDMNFLQKEQEIEDEDDPMKKLEPFTYITEENLKRLIYLFLLRKEEPWVIAIVLNYIKPELARQVLSLLPVEMQSKVAMESLTVKQATREQIKAIDKEIRENIDFVMGGIEKFARMLEEAEPAIRKNIFEYLKTQKPEIYEKVKRKVLTFDDIVNFPDKDMQVVIRSVSIEDIAKAVYKADPQIVNKFFTNMSQGSVNAIKEIMEYSGELTPVLVDEAQTKVLDAVKRLEVEGKINVRQQNSQEIDIIDGSEMSTEAQRSQKFRNISGGGEAPAAAGAVSPENAAQAKQYLAAGADLYNQGRHEESLQYLEYAASLDAGQAEAQQYLGAAYYALGRAQDAIRAYERYAQLSNDPAVTEWLNNFKQQAGK